MITKIILSTWIVVSDETSYFIFIRAFELSCVRDSNLVEIFKTPNIMWDKKTPKLY